MLAFSADRKELVSAITRAAQGLSSRPQNPVHAGMLVTGMTEGISLTASDGDVTFTSSCGADITGTGSVIIPGRMLAEISRYFTGESVSLECGDPSLGEDPVAVIISGKSRFTLEISPGEKYPRWSETPGALGTLDAADFASAVKAILSCASRVHPVMRGIRMELSDGRLLLTATDGSRMAFACPQVSTAGENVPAAILAPSAVLGHFAAACEGEVSFGWGDGVNLLGLRSQGLEMVTPLIAGEFHKSWVMIQEDHEPVVTADAAELAQMTRMAALAAGDQGAVTLDFADVLTVRASGSAGYSGELPLEGKPDPRVLDFAPQYLLDASQGEKVSLAWTGRALMIISDHCRTLIQPRRRITTGIS